MADRIKITRQYLDEMMKGNDLTSLIGLEAVKDQILNDLDENENLKKENKYLKEDAELRNDIDWSDDCQRECPTHEQNYHIYYKKCKIEIKNLRHIVKESLPFLERIGGAMDIVEKIEKVMQK